MESQIGSILAGDILSDQNVFATELRMHLSGYDASTHKIKDADGKIALLDRDGEIAAEWSFSKIMEHWSKKHSKVVYVPSQCKKVPERKYQYGSKVRLAEGTDPLKLFQAMAQRICIL